MTSTPNDRQNSFDAFNDRDEREAHLTAYALGELSGDDQAALERELETNPELRAELEAIRATVDRLEAALGAEAAPGLTDEQHRRIAQETAGESPASGPADEAPENDDRGPVIFTFSRVAAGAGVLAAACLLIVFAVVPMLGRADLTRDQARVDESAEAETANASTEAEERLELRDAASAERSRGNNVQAGQGVAGDAIGGGESASAGARRSEESMEFGKARIDGDARIAGEPSVMLDPAAAPYGGAAELEQESPPTLPLAPPSREKTLEFVRQLQGQGALSASPPAPATAPSGDAIVWPMDPDFRDPNQGPSAPFVSWGTDEVEASEASARASRQVLPQLSREAYSRLVDNPFHSPINEPLSTFSIDVDTASYSNVRRMLRQGVRPPADAVRIEEFINAFDYSYEPASGEHPFSVNLDVGRAPWNPEHRLVRIGLQGREVDVDMRPATNLVFLLDVSGSMNDRNKLPLVKQSMRMLIDRLNEDDRVAIVVYAGASGLVLPSTYLNEKETVLDAIDRLHAGGSTNGGAGIELAYRVAEENFIKDGVNRVILCTDGDFNVGVSSEGELVRLIEEKRESGVELSVLGFGAGNWQDARMEQLSNAGNGNFAYIDSMDEAQRVLVENLAGTLVTIAKDVKIQVEFNPAKVQAYRLLGYANRLLAAEDFNDDTKDAGEIGAGHTVTALYEIVPPGVEFDMNDQRAVDPLKYQPNGHADVAAKVESDEDGDADAVEAGQDHSDELLTVKLRYKQPGGDVSRLIERPLKNRGPEIGEGSEDFNLAASLAGFGMLLRESAYRGDASWPLVRELAVSAVRNDPSGRRAELLALIDAAAKIIGPIEPVAAPKPPAGEARAAENDDEAGEVPSAPGRSEDEEPAVKPIPQNMEDGAGAVTPSAEEARAIKTAKAFLRGLVDWTDRADFRARRAGDQWIITAVPPVDVRASRLEVRINRDGEVETFQRNSESD